MRKETGGFAISKAGHDKGKLYAVIGYREGKYLLADGRIRTLEKAKPKKEKHLQFIHAQDERLAELMRGGKPVRNEDVKRAIKLYQAKVPTK
ncbi:KOW domain-containing RNA-binding protein [Qiania dongpingensis]|uniref:KOW domain-containing RNA-binding protein n=1 Tax=Qiania dongpingensis TaxID=2763669 RepID=A0A7G9G257_9FIRM|nr:KOW domain-containing RNA-binding protein [Qiania dongpingensis]QNM04889.1 KOW domain-containing RNA-binding protein [Qiania dongpingensis]